MIGNRYEPGRQALAQGGRLVELVTAGAALLVRRRRPARARASASVRRSRERHGRRHRASRTSIVIREHLVQRWPGESQLRHRQLPDQRHHARAELRVRRVRRRLHPGRLRRPGRHRPRSADRRGLAGTACAGQDVHDRAHRRRAGQVQLHAGRHGHPRAAGARPPAASCTINFTSTVLKAPDDRLDAATAGLQTDQKAFTDAEVITVGSPNFGLTAGGVGTARTTIARATPTITTVASPSTAAAGTALTDNATMSGLVNPVAGATVEFRLYGPNDETCAGRRSSPRRTGR